MNLFNTFKELIWGDPNEEDFDFDEKGKELLKSNISSKLNIHQKNLNNLDDQKLEIFNALLIACLSQIFKEIKFHHLALIELLYF